MLDVFHIAKRQNCDIQMFYSAGGTGITNAQRSWLKPRGVSNVYMMLIGCGGNGNGTTGGGSGAVTVWYGAAANVPDNLIIRVPTYSSNNDTEIYALAPNSNGITLLLSADNGGVTTGGVAMTANQFCASGFFQSVAGQNGAASNLSPSSTTFLSGGAGTSVTANYGYSTTGGSYFQMQPIIVGVGVASSASPPNQPIAGIGCGGGLNNYGGSSMVLIASW
jgi:hypothetical protein